MFLDFFIFKLIFLSCSRSLTLYSFIHSILFSFIIFKTYSLFYNFSIALCIVNDLIVCSNCFSVFISSSMLLMRSSTPDFGASMFRILMLSWPIVFFFAYNEVFLFTSFDQFQFKVHFISSYDSNGCVVVPFDWSNFVHPFILRQCLSLKLR